MSVLHTKSSIQTFPLASPGEKSLDSVLTWPYRDRIEAGKILSTHLRHYANRPDVVVLALPRGGVPVGFEVAQALSAPLDVFVVRKLGVPNQPELAMGAIASGQVQVLDDYVVRSLCIPDQVIQAVSTKAKKELKLREHLYRGNQPPTDITGRTVIIVDDGVATGSTLHVAVRALHPQHPKRIVIGVPVAPMDIYHEFEDEVDEIVCGNTPSPFHSVSFWYEDFSQTSDTEVRHLLKRAAQHVSVSAN